jgi:6-phosphogluconolactonase
MELQVFPNADAVAREAASWLAQQAREAVVARGRFSLAVSGGSTPWQMLRALAEEEVPWPHVHLFQVDERIAPDGHSDRNLTHLLASLLPRVPLPLSNLHAMPVNDSDVDAAAERYARTVTNFAGNQGVLDVVHLGLGADGHTASLVPGDRVLQIVDHDVAVTGIYQGRQRMTLTYPLLNRARMILWVATGTAKVEMLRRLQQNDRSIPAGHVRCDNALIFADRDAIGEQSTDR